MRRPDRQWISLVTAALLLAACGHAPSTGSANANPRNEPSTQPPEHPATAPPPTEPSTQPGDALEDQLIGTWVAPDVDVKLGQVKIKLTFKRQGKMHLIAWSDIPFVGQVRNKTGPYQVHGHVISSKAIRGGTSVNFWFDKGQLVIRYAQGKTVRFDRIG